MRHHIKICLLPRSRRRQDYLLCINIGIIMEGFNTYSMIREESGQALNRILIINRIIHTEAVWKVAPVSIRLPAKITLAIPWFSLVL